MLKKLSGLLAGAALLLSSGTIADVRAESTWSAIKPAIFQERVIHQSTGIIKLDAPYRTIDDRTIPITVDALVPDGRTIRSITLLADDNPMPVIAVLRLANAETRFKLGLNIRLDGTSPIRAVVETSDGALYMTEKLVKTSGQGACASPPVTDLDKVSDTIGQMAFSDVDVDAATSGQTLINRRGRLKITHPNLTGLQMNQITMQHIPARYVDTLTVWNGEQQLFTIESGITLSENPEIEFDYRLNGSANLTVVATDTEGTKFKSVLPVGPSS
ncbi:MAG: quinoprotein dehydrogenase-associated SoxYZ-like carrier [Hyphomicrobiales bacterium]|nr:quinoprotein dehydrogenase-associated SoxYZ-like carrier [Hyphomicrobiales bacterium]